MEIRLTTDEMYPVYYETDIRHGNLYEVPEELWIEYSSTLKSFREVLEKLKECIDSSKTK